MTTHSRTEAVLYESEAALRLVDQEILDLRGIVPPHERDLTGDSGDLPRLVGRANQQILQLLASVRETRAALSRTVFHEHADAQHLHEFAARQLATTAAALVGMESHLIEVATMFEAATDVASPAGAYHAGAGEIFPPMSVPTA